MFIQNLKDSPFANYITQLGNKLYYVTSYETDIENKLITKPLTDFIKLHVRADEIFFVSNKETTRNNKYCLKNIIVFINENCKEDAYIIDFPNYSISSVLLCIIFNNEEDRVLFKLTFNGFNTSTIIDAFK